MRRLRLRQLHRWAGISSLVFLIVLSTTGIALNHAPGMGLGTISIDTGWILDVYGIESPEVAESYSLGAGRWVARAGERVYVDGHDVLAGAQQLLGAVVADSGVFVATDNRLVAFSGGYQRIDELRIDAIEAVGLGRLVVSDNAASTNAASSVAAFIVLRTPFGRRFFEPASFTELALDAADVEVLWSEPADLQKADLTLLQQALRGEGVSVERMLYDIHSGRIFGNLGTLIIDIIAVLAVFLSVTGLIIWMKPRRS